jgi:hypothetical protein
MMAVSAALRGAWCIGASSPLSWSRCGGIEFGGLRNAIEAVRVFFNARPYKNDPLPKLCRKATPRSVSSMSLKKSSCDSRLSPEVRETEMDERVLEARSLTFLESAEIA